MSADSYALARIEADLVSRGFSALLAPTPAKEVLARINRGEDADGALQAVASDWGATLSPPSPKPVPEQPAEPRRRVLATIAGAYPLKARADL